MTPATVYVDDAAVASFRYLAHAMQEARIYRMFYPRASVFVLPA